MGALVVEVSYVDLEAGVVPGVVIHYESTGVADYFCQATQCDDGAEGWEAGLDCQEELGYGRYAEECEENDVGCQVRPVAVCGAFDGTFWCDGSAVLERVEGGVGGHFVGPGR